MKKFYFLTKTFLLAVMLCIGASNAWADVTPYSEDYEGDGATCDWTSSQTGRYTTSLAETSGNHYVQVSAVGNGNSGALTKSNSTNGKAASGDNYTLIFDLKITGGNNQLSWFQINDANNSDTDVNSDADPTKCMLLFKLTEANGSTWKINNNAGQTVTMDKSHWNRVKLVVYGGETYLTVTDLSTSTDVFHFAKITTNSTKGGLGGIQFATKRYNSSMAIDNVVVREVNTATDVINPAIADCKAHETSAAFATAIDAASFTTYDEVYAFHTSWQVENAGSNDITKVIFDAAVSDFSRWNSARNNSGEAYTGAPDTKYFDAWNNEASDAKQKIYGLPAGTYTLKVATRASEDVADKSKYNVWVNGGSANVSVLGSHIGSSDGNLEHGWNWTILSFTLAAKADVEIGFYSCPPTNLWAGCDDFHLYKGMLAENVSVTVSEAGYATLVSPYALNFTSTYIKAYRAVVDTENGIVNLEQENQIPSNTPVVLYYAGGKTEDIPVIGAADALGDNDLKAGTGGAVATGTNPYNYILNNVSGIGFYKAAGKTVAADRAYLQTTYTSSGARGMTLVIDDEKITGISEAKAEAEFAKEGKFVVDGKLLIFKKGMKFNANGQLVK